MPVSPHGGLDSAVFSRQQQHLYQRIVAWAGAVSTSGPERAVETSGPRIMEAMADHFPDGEKRMDARIRGAGPLREQSGDAHSHLPAEVDSSTAQQEFRAKDPFDPEVFNRRYHRPQKPNVLQTRGESGSP